MYDYMRRFGFGQKTGIAAARPSRSGKFRKLARWGKTSLASVSMGQEVSVTTLQLAQAASVIANGGLLVKPRLVLKKGDQVDPAGAAGPHHQAGDGDHDAPDDGRRGAARAPGSARGWPAIRAAARPAPRRFSTAPRNHYTHTYNGSFMGFAPLTNPAVVVVVTLNGTHGEGGFGGYAAAPVFQGSRCRSAARAATFPKTCRKRPNSRR